ncbi:MAG: winged helix-turn-helix transcriptional regulator [Chloroflexota bacterium]
MTDNHIDQTSEALFGFIRTYIHENGYSPSLREIAEGCYLGRSTVLRYLDKLEAKGRIARTIGKARSIALLEEHGFEVGTNGRTDGRHR